VAPESLGVLLVEPWLGGSHEAWAAGWMRHSSHDIHLVSLPADHWQQRMVSSTASLAEQVSRHLEAHGRPDVVVATDMVDLASLLGLCRRELAGCVTVLYMHENQLTQPVSANGVGDGRGRHLAWTNWRSVLAADSVWFNSRWQLDSMAAALPALFDTSPEPADHLELVAGFLERSCVMACGCDLARMAAPGREPSLRPDRSCPVVLWNHRWSNDKGLDRAVKSMATLSREGVAFDVVVLGSDDHHDPAMGDALLEPISGRVVHRGHVVDRHYPSAVRGCDVVVAAARQENFGISVVEAVAAGCVPVVPDALAFRETVDDPAFRYPEGRLTTHLRNVLVDLPTWRQRAGTMAQAVRRYDWPVMAAEYDDAVGKLVETRGGRSRRTEDR